eukprot:86693_1
MMYCSVFIFKKFQCKQGKLNIGNDCYEIIYTPDKGKSILYRCNNAIISSHNSLIRNKIVILWPQISGLKRTNKKMEYNFKHSTQQKIDFKEHLIIELLSHPKEFTERYNPNTKQWDTLGYTKLNTHYIGLEYNSINTHYLLGGNDNNSYFDHYPSKSLLLNDSLPEFIWIPLLNHNLRVLIQRLMIITNIILFLWTIYQLTKYADIIKQLFRPMFDYVSKKLLKQMYYYYNLMQFDIIWHTISYIFTLLYEAAPITFLYKVCNGFNRHILQQFSSVFKIIYGVLFHLISSINCKALSTIIHKIFNHLISFIKIDFTKCMNVFHGLRRIIQPFINLFKPIYNLLLYFCSLITILCTKTYGIIETFMDLFGKINCANCMKMFSLGKKSQTVYLKTNQNKCCRCIYQLYNGIKHLFNMLSMPIKLCYALFGYIRGIPERLICKCCKKSKEQTATPHPSNVNKITPQNTVKLRSKNKTKFTKTL